MLLVALPTDLNLPQARANHAFAAAALHDARRAKGSAYPELTRGGRCRFVSLGIETGGRSSAETASFISLLAKTRAQAVPHYFGRRRSSPA